MKRFLSLVVCFFVLLLVTASYAQDSDREAVSKGAGIRQIFGGFTCNIFCFFFFSVAGVACIVIIYSGLMYIISRDVSEREELKKRIIYVFIGLVLFAVMVPVVNYVSGLGSVNMSPFGCNCLNGSMEEYTPPVVGTTLPGLRAIIVKPRNGEELDMDRLVSFVGRGYGGVAPYSYKWTSNADGNIGSADSFMNNLSRGNHTITLELTDSVANYTSAQVNVSVIVPKPKP